MLDTIDNDTRQPSILRSEDGALWVQMRDAGGSGISADNAMPVIDPTIRNPTSETNAYGVVREECNATSVDLSSDSTTVSAVPAHFYGWEVTVGLSAHACPIKDGLTTLVTIPSGAAVADRQLYPGVRFETSLVVDPDNAGTGTVTIFWRPI